jgi:hypothetical protein
VGSVDDYCYQDHRVSNSIYLVQASRFRLICTSLMLQRRVFSNNIAVSFFVNPSGHDPRSINAATSLGLSYRHTRDNEHYSTKYITKKGQGILYDRCTNRSDRRYFSNSASLLVHSSFISSSCPLRSAGNIQPPSRLRGQI